MQKVRLLLGGDIMLGRGVNSIIHQRGYQFPFEPISEFTNKADLFFANLECAISDHEISFSGTPKMFYFRADSTTTHSLRYAGIDLLSLANNHALDANYQGLLDTMKHLDSAGIQYTGAGKNREEAWKPVIIEVSNLKIGVLAFCNHQANFAATSQQPGIAYINFSDHTIENMITSISDLHDKVDMTIVSIHWQPNFAPMITQKYQNLAHKMITAGADIIWGHSPHHFQGIEWIDGHPVLYSCGDLLDDYLVDPDFRNNLQLLFLIELSGSYILNIQAYPLKLSYAQTDFASNEHDLRWIQNHFIKSCEELGTRVTNNVSFFELTNPALRKQNER